jgi:dTDP-4-dehydrorhamnose 3,5-epimerase-like enzyme
MPARLMKGDVSVDDRGQVGFVNEFDFQGVKRFYSVANHVAGLVRAWHAHRHEAKYVTCVSGAAVVGVVEIADWEAPVAAGAPSRFVLSAAKPQVLYIPAGHANGFMSLTPDTKLMFFSTATLQDSLNDDVRYGARTWDIWAVEER